LHRDFGSLGAAEDPRATDAARPDQPVKTSLRKYQVDWPLAPELGAEGALALSGRRPAVMAAPFPRYAASIDLWNVYVRC
jgi:hypothetical protein